MLLQKSDIYDANYFLGTSDTRGKFSLLDLDEKFLDRAQTVIDYFGLTQMDTGIIAEVGCGTAPFYRICRENPQLKQVKVTCIDITDEGVKLLDSTERPAIIVASVNSLPFESKSLEGAILWDVLEHIENPKAALDELQRILKPGGFLHIVCPNPDSWARNGSDPENDVYRRDKTHIFPPIVTIDFLDNALRKSDFSFELYTRGFKNPKNKKQTGLSSMRLAHDDPSGTHIVAFATKRKLP